MKQGSSAIALLQEATGLPTSCLDSYSVLSHPGGDCVTLIHTHWAELLRGMWHGDLFLAVAIAELLVVNVHCPYLGRGDADGTDFPTFLLTLIVSIMASGSRGRWIIS